MAADLRRQYEAVPGLEEASLDLKDFCYSVMVTTKMHRKHQKH